MRTAGTTPGVPMHLPRLSLIFLEGILSAYSLADSRKARMRSACRRALTESTVRFQGPRQFLVGFCAKQLVLFRRPELSTGIWNAQLLPANAHRGQVASQAGGYSRVGSRAQQRLFFRRPGLATRKADGDAQPEAAMRHSQRGFSQIHRSTIRLRKMFMYRTPA